MLVPLAPADADPSPLQPRLREAVDDIHVDASRLIAHVGGTQVTADTLSGLRHALANKLYEVLHAGLDTLSGPRPRTLRDEPYEKLLAQAVPHRETVLSVPATSVHEADDEAGQATVVLDGVRTLVPRHLLSPGPGADRVTVRYPCARPALSAGFFLVDGSTGRPAGEETVRLYVHVRDPRSAPEIWRLLLLRLEARAVPYRAKASSSPLLYPRRDAIVVYLDGGRAGEDTAMDVAAPLADRPGLGSETSLFARRIAPGLALADEPDDPRTGMNHMSFGQHRAHAVAQGLVDHALAPDTADKRAAVSRSMVRSRIRPDAPWHNVPRSVSAHEPVQEQPMRPV
ncbi:T3SS effector HopA1 family protein [Streptomyces murinus]|uniref:T3SS effector HopA1 family protein n=1 Tax=Streptomyces murinus TaxID=33900 RepID=UPI0037263294